jgi:hypothetical protein
MDFPTVMHHPHRYDWSVVIEDIAEYSRLAAIGWISNTDWHSGVKESADIVEEVKEEVKKRGRPRKTDDE